MPYIKEQARNALDRGAIPCDPGELNYVLIQKILSYLGDKPHYADFNNALGVLTAVQLELYRRMVAPYEDTKRDENGDIFPAENDAEEALTK